MSVQCVTCSRFTLRGAPMAREGFGCCSLKKPSESVSARYPRECRSHEQAEADVVEKRVAWFKSNSVRETEGGA